jgi:chromate reductase
MDMKILGIVGSLRKGSFNQALMDAAIAMVPEGVTIETFDIGKLSLFNQDLEANMPDEAKEFKQKIREADAILFATPEYNYSMPGVLKNAIDWGSRPYGDSAWEGKPVGIMSAAGSAFGGVRAQMHLRQTFVFLNMYSLNKPEVLVPNAYEKIDPEGNITDEHTKEKIQEMVDALIAWTQKLTK